MLSFFVILALAWLYYIVYTKPYGEKPCQPSMI